MRTRAIIFACLMAVSAQMAYAQVGKENFPDRKALIVNSCPFVELSEFEFHNRFDSRATRFFQMLRWRNIGPQALSAFEVVVLKYDSFDRRLMGSQWVVTGKNSGDWSPLLPGESERDGIWSYSVEKVFTAIAFVRSARLQDGTVWQVDEAALLDDLKKIAPSLKNFGSLEPEAEPPIPKQ